MVPIKVKTFVLFKPGFGVIGYKAVRQASRGNFFAQR